MNKQCYFKGKDGECAKMSDSETIEYCVEGVCEYDTTFLVCDPPERDQDQYSYLKEFYARRNHKQYLEKVMTE